ncbi:MAG TPA: urease accessory protein UreD [Polyangiaceae bacterium]|jgi:urease accessory protein|nr:urease accessory protein UreD [Polyangiaceae bacterium]
MIAEPSIRATDAGGVHPRSAGWAAELELGFEVVAGRSALTRNRHRGPLAVQRAFYPESSDLAHVYLLHPPGGVVAGDQLTVRVDVAPAARALITTPAATKFYRSEGRVAQQTQLLRVSEAASLEWLPQETIVFGSARVSTKTRVELELGASFCGWDIVCLGRAASGDHFGSGRLQQAFEIWQGDRPLWIERADFDAHQPVRFARWGLGGHRVFGTFVCTGQNAAAVAAARAAVDTDESRELFAVSQMRAAIVCRYLGSSTERARAVFAQAWAALRPAVIGRPASPPRIWLT